MKYTLEIYYDKDLRQFNTNFDLTIINNKNYIHSKFFNHDGWKIKSNKLRKSSKSTKSKQ
jgi:hypothetical protein